MFIICLSALSSIAGHLTTLALPLLQQDFFSNNSILTLFNKLNATKCLISERFSRNTVLKFFSSFFNYCMLACL